MILKTFISIQHLKNEMTAAVAGSRPATTIIMRLDMAVGAYTRDADEERPPIESKMFKKNYEMHFKRFYTR